MNEKKRECRPRIIRALVDQIYQLHYENGISVRQLSADFNKPYKTIEGLITRENKRRKMTESSKKKALGRPLTVVGELARLRMENELLRDFLLAAGKR